jgi:hypothetical protein
MRSSCGIALERHRHYDVSQGGTWLWQYGMARPVRTTHGRCLQRRTSLVGLQCEVQCPHWRHHKLFSLACSGRLAWRREAQQRRVPA